jgi:hypothetical protein
MTMLENSHGSRPDYQPAEAAFEFEVHNPFEAEVAERAVGYTAICFMVRGQYDRRDYGTYDEALAGAPAHQAACAKPVLIYAYCDRRYTALMATLPRPKNSRNGS